MLYTIVLQDNPGVDAARAQHRDGHLAHFKAHKARLALSGPLLAEDGTSKGSLVIVEAETAAQAEAFIKADPFYDANVWGDVSISQLKASLFDATKFTS